MGIPYYEAVQEVDDNKKFYKTALGITMSILFLNNAASFQEVICRMQVTFFDDFCKIWAIFTVDIDFGLKYAILPSLTLVTIKKALIHFIIWVLEPLYMQENVAIFLLFSSL